MKRHGTPAHDRHERHGRSPAAPAEPVARITTAVTPLSDDVAQRTRRYLIQMSIRLVCFLGAVLIDHWTRWLLLLGAVVLPYVAVVLANAGRERRTEPASYLEPRTLPAGPSRPTAPRPGVGREGAATGDDRVGEDGSP